MKNRRWRLALGLAAVAAWLALPSPALAAKAKKVDLNTATQQKLEELPGVGEATAKKIIAGRPYSSVADLEKAGVPKSTIDKISSKVTVSKSKSKETAAKTEQSEAKPEKTSKSESKPAASSGAKVDLNNASQKELEELPGVGSATAKKIIAGRPYASLDDLAKAGVGKSTIEKIRSQVTLGAAPAAAGKAASSEKPSTSRSSEASSSSRSSTSSSSAKSSEASTPRQPPPAKGMVWVNTATKVYHYEGDKWYGNTKEGKYMTEDDAIKAGYRASKEGQKKQ